MTAVDRDGHVWSLAAANDAGAVVSGNVRDVGRVVGDVAEVDARALVLCQGADLFEAGS